MVDGPRPSPQVPARTRPVLAGCLGLVVVTVSVAAAWVAGEPVPGKLVVLPVFWTVPGTLIAAGRPRNPLGWLMLGVGAGFAASGFGSAWVEADHRTGAAWAVWSTDRAAALIVPLTLAVLLLLPDGRLPSPRWRRPAELLVGLQVAVVATWSLARGPAAAPDSDWPGWAADLANPVGVLPSAWAEAITGLDVWLLQVPLLAGIVAIGVRLRHPAGDERRRLVSVLAATAVFVLLVVVGRGLWPAAAAVLDVLGSALLALALTSAVLRRRMHEVDVVVGRAFVYAVLTALIALVYLAAVAAAGALGRELPPLGIGLLTGLAALALLPLRGHLQRLLDRALYGAARDPRVAVARLTGELAASRQQIVTAREEERSRLRRDLHDELGPTLAGLSMQLGDLREVVEDDPRTARDRLGHLESAARDALDGVRRVTRELRPPSLDELGLVGALADVAAHQGLALEVRADLGVAPLPPAVEVATYRIAAEALTNTARHADTDRACLELCRTRDELRLRVVDRGVGSGTRTPGVGIQSMRERAAELGGHVEIGDTEGGGTTVEARLPTLAPVAPQEPSP